MAMACRRSRDFEDGPFLSPDLPYIQDQATFCAILGTNIMASSALVSILITFLVVILVLYLVGMLPVDARAKQIVRIIVIVIGIISLLKYLAVF